MTWNKRFSSKMNRSSWKTAHEGDHPQIEDMDDLQAHLVSHHSGDFLGDLDDHEWFHLDPEGYNDFHHEHNWPIEDNQPDHYHTNDYEKLNVPNSLPPSFASFKKKSDPGSLRGEGVPAFTEPGYQDDQDEDDQVVGPQDLDSNATTVDKFPKSVGVFKNSFSEFGNPIDGNNNRMQSVESPGLELRYPLDTGKRDYAEQREDANPIPLRSWYTGDDVNGPWPHTKNLSGPLDFEPTDDQNKDSTGPVMSSFQSRYSHVGKHPWPEGIEKLVDHYFSHHQNFTNYLFNDEEGKKDMEQVIRDDPFTAHSVHASIHLDPSYRSTFYGPENHEHDDDSEKLDIPDNIEAISPKYINASKTSSWKTSHMHNVNHPWPRNASELEEHLLSHHQNLLDSMNREVNIPPEHWDYISKQTIRRAPDVAFNAHQVVHKKPDRRNSKYFGPEDHEHNDDDLGIDIPENIEEISPTYVTSSWHEAFVETFDTHPDEDNPDTLLNPADELKNGRPRANDLPNQSAQLIPGMLIDHDQMGGSGTSSAGF